MATLLVNHKVSDYDAWRPVYDEAMAAEWSSPIRSHHVWRGQDDPNHVIVASRFDSREAAEAFSKSPELREAMGRAGAIESTVQVHIMDEVASGPR
jgi:heme-degrading monooxygenase HmoA